MERSRADPCVLRTVLDWEVNLIVSAHVDDLLIALTAKDKETFHVFHAQLKENFLVSDMGDLSRYFGCAFERDTMEGIVKKTQAAFVDSLVNRFLVYNIRARLPRP